MIAHYFLTGPLTGVRLLGSLSSSVRKAFLEPLNYLHSLRLSLRSALPLWGFSFQSQLTVIFLLSINTYFQLYIYMWVTHLPRLEERNQSLYTSLSHCVDTQYLKHKGYMLSIFPTNVNFGLEGLDQYCPLRECFRNL